MKQFLIILFLGLNFLVSAQTEPQANDSTLYVITTMKGREYIGQILSDDGREILIQTADLGKIYLKKETIKSIVKAPLVIKQDDELITESPFTTRYVFTNNALPIRKKENYAIWSWYGPEMHIALTSRFNLGFMTTWISSPFAVAAKYTFAKQDNRKLYFSMGSIVGTSGWMFSGRGAGGLHWLSATVGDRFRNLTASAGWSWVRTGRTEYEEGIYVTGGNNGQIPRTSFNLTQGPVFAFSGIAQIGSKVSFIMDNLLTIPQILDVNRTRTLLTDGGIDPITGQWVDATYEEKIVHSRKNFIYYMAMPGFRFQKNKDLAFQFCMAIVRIQKENKEPFTFPFPMISWFQRF